MVRYVGRFAIVIGFLLAAQYSKTHIARRQVFKNASPAVICSSPPLQLQLQLHG